MSIQQVRAQPVQLPKGDPLSEVRQRNPFPSVPEQLQRLTAEVVRRKIEPTPSVMSRISSWFSSWFSSSQQELSEPPELYSNYTWKTFGNSAATSVSIGTTIWGAVELSQGHPAAGGVLIAVALLVKIAWAANVHGIITNSQSYQSLARLGAKFIHGAETAYNKLTTAAGATLTQMGRELKKAEADRLKTQAAIADEVQRLQGTGEVLALTVGSNFDLFQRLSEAFKRAQEQNELTLQSLQEENAKKTLLLDSLGESIQVLKTFTKEIQESQIAYQSLKAILGEQQEQLKLTDGTETSSQVVSVNSNLQGLVETILGTLKHLQHLPQLLEPLDPKTQLEQLLKIQESVHISTKTLGDLGKMRDELHTGITELRGLIEQQVTEGQQAILDKLAALDQKLHPSIT